MNSSSCVLLQKSCSTSLQLRKEQRRSQRQRCFSQEGMRVHRGWVLIVPNSPCVQANLAEKLSGFQWSGKPERQGEQCLSQPYVFPPPLVPWEVAAALVGNDWNVHPQQQKPALKKAHSQVNVSELLIKLGVDCKTKNEANVLHNLLDCCCVCMRVFIDSSSSIVNWINHRKRRTPFIFLVPFQRCFVCSGLEHGLS